jgi:hypothetical protein
MPCCPPKTILQDRWRPLWSSRFRNLLLIVCQVVLLPIVVPQSVKFVSFGIWFSLVSQLGTPSFRCYISNFDRGSCCLLQFVRSLKYPPPSQQAKLHSHRVGFKARAQCCYDKYRFLSFQNNGKHSLKISNLHDHFGTKLLDLLAVIFFSTNKMLF